MSDDPRPAIALVIDNAEEVPFAPSNPPPDHGGRGDLPKGCPIEPLGVLGDVFYYLDDLRQLRGLPARDHSRLGVLALFGERNYLLETFWPRLDKDGRASGWRPEKAAEQLMASAASRGVWDPFERVRGRGAWRGEDGALILHCGDDILRGGAWHKPGKIERHVYPAGAAILKPAMGSATKEPGEQLLSLLNSWRWRRGDLDATLLLGWIGAAMIGGALDWRPAVWLTGSRGSGKSTLHKLIGRLLDGGLLQVSEASAAGLWQKLAHSTLPVTFDELEAEQDGRKAQAVIKLARQAASGGLVLRGGADHNAAEFIARSCFLFSSILVPPLLGQDRSRMAILELDELGQDAPPDLEAGMLRLLGGQILKRLIEQWGRLGQALAMFRDALAREGHSARGADVFGTLLAVADLLTSDAAVDSDTAHEAALQLSAGTLAETSDDVRDEERCLQQVLTSALPRDGGGVARRSIATWIERAADDQADAWREAQQILGTYGLRVMKTDQNGARRAWLAVANYHTELAKLFQGTHWEGRSGTMGVWTQALRRLPGAEAFRMNVRFAGAQAKATFVPLEVVVSKKDEDEMPVRVSSGGELL